MEPVYGHQGCKASIIHRCVVTHHTSFLYPVQFLGKLKFVHKNGTKIYLPFPICRQCSQKAMQQDSGHRTALKVLRPDGVCFLGSTHTGQAVSRACYLPVSLTSRQVRRPLRCIMLRRVTSGLSDLGSQSRVLLANGFVVLQDLLQVAHSLFTILCFNLWREGNFKSLLYQVRPISLCQIKSQTMPYVVQQQCKLVVWYKIRGPYIPVPPGL